MHLRKHWDKYIFVGVIATVVIALSIGYVDCNGRGGDYVRGLFWMNCINAGENS